MIEHESAQRLVTATNLRELIANRDRAVDVHRLHAVVSMSLDDLVALAS
ncbi:MAG TPA: hypothetical protein VJZ76_14480 [Thermoanaerobaculia bacterium]|nr:hypothetical protein [Thermoanaerobaculia bacterium]